MFDIAIEALINLLDDAMDELFLGDPNTYTAEQRQRLLECYEHWLTTGFTESDIAYLRSQLTDFGDCE